MHRYNHDHDNDPVIMMQNPNLLPAEHIVVPYRRVHLCRTPEEFHRAKEAELSQFLHKFQNDATILALLALRYRISYLTKEDVVSFFHLVWNDQQRVLNLLRASHFPSLQNAIQKMRSERETVQRNAVQKTREAADAKAKEDRINAHNHLTSTFKQTGEAANTLLVKYGAAPILKLASFCKETVITPEDIHTYLALPDLEKNYVQSFQNKKYNIPSLKLAIDLAKRLLTDGTCSIFFTAKLDYQYFLLDLTHPQLKAFALLNKFGVTYDEFAKNKNIYDTDVLNVVKKLFDKFKDRKVFDLLIKPETTSADIALFGMLCLNDTKSAEEAATIAPTLTPTQIKYILLGLKFAVATSGITPLQMDLILNTRDYFEKPKTKMEHSLTLTDFLKNPWLNNTKALCDYATLLNKLSLSKAETLLLLQNASPAELELHLVGISKNELTHIKQSDPTLARAVSLKNFLPGKSPEVQTAALRCKKATEPTTLFMLNNMSPEEAKALTRVQSDANDLHTQVMRLLMPYIEENRLSAFHSRDKKINFRRGFCTLFFVGMRSENREANYKTAVELQLRIARGEDLTTLLSKEKIADIRSQFKHSLGINSNTLNAALDKARRLVAQHSELSSRKAP